MKNTLRLSLLLVTGGAALALASPAYADDNDQFNPAPAAQPYSQERARHENQIKTNADDFLAGRKTHQQAMDSADVPDDSPDAKIGDAPPVRAAPAPAAAAPQK